MNPATLIWLVPQLLQVMHEAPQLLSAVEAFWQHVTNHTPAPEHVEQAVQAAFVRMRPGEVG